MKHYSTHGEYFETHGQAQQKRTSWVSKADRALLKHPRHIEKMFKMFADTKFHYKFVVVDTPDFGFIDGMITYDVNLEN